MKRITLFALIAVLALGLANPPVYAQKKLAQTGMQFLSVGTDARATAMGEAYTTIDAGASSIFYNPACMALFSNTLEFTAAQMTWIADINYFSGALAYRPKRGLYGVFGLSFSTVDYGDFQGTLVNRDLEAGYEDTDVFSPSAMAVGFSYANALTDRFSVGGTIKYVYQDLGSHLIVANESVKYSDITEDDLNTEKFDMTVAAVDFGTFYRTGFKSLAFGMSVRNFSREVQYEKESFQLPLTFRIGFSVDVLDFVPMELEGHSFLLAVDAAHPRSFPEYISVGGEYTLMEILSLRAGFIGSQDDYGMTAGFGVQKFGVGIHYSYSPFDTFEDVSRFSVRVSL
ncbi:PorV/PorQ family protein [candidate division KSB1 bacterium]|nr:PorV/PorQ family protein [candidate division KSB1 bacterium]